MELSIRQEEKHDYAVVRELIKSAFETMDFSDHKEQDLVQRLRKSSAFIPAFSLVAEQDDIIVGHILLTKIRIVSNRETSETLALAPVSVLPTFQGLGIGGELIKKAHSVAAQLGYKLIALLGHSDYYPRFGYVRASKYGIQFPFDAPDENCMMIELVERGLAGVSGTLQYPKEFFE